MGKKERSLILLPNCLCLRLFLIIYQGRGDIGGKEIEWTERREMGYRKRRERDEERERERDGVQKERRGKKDFLFLAFYQIMSKDSSLLSTRRVGKEIGEGKRGQRGREGKRGREREGKRGRERGEARGRERGSEREREGK